MKNTLEKKSLPMDENLSRIRSEMQVCLDYLNGDGPDKNGAWKGNQIENRYSHWIWRQYASAFWDDIRIGRVLPFKAARDSDDEKHVHPLQLDVIERVLTLWSNPGENVMTPFMGVGSEVCGALVNGRRGVGIELKPSYYHQSKKNIASVLKNGWDDGSGQEHLPLESLVEDEEDMEDSAPWEKEESLDTDKYGD